MNTALPIVQPQASCARCGECCRRIWIACAPEVVLEHAAAAERDGDRESSAPFILKYWTPTGETSGPPDDEWHRYTCAKFDEATSSCTAHDERPQVCRGYPFYGRDPYETIGPRGFLQCSFWADMPRPWPEGVDPLPSAPA